MGPFQIASRVGRCASAALVACSVAACSSGANVAAPASAATAKPKPSLHRARLAAPWFVPVDVANSSSPSQGDWADLAWRSFVALNWPSIVPPSSARNGIAGLPDPSRPIGSRSANGALIPTVWLTYRSEANTMLPGAQNPGPWLSNPLAIPSSCAPMSSSLPIAPGFTPMLLNMTSKFNASPASNVNEASGPPLIDQTGWYVTYDIRIDRSEYTYIQQNGYYNGATQAAAEKQNGQLLPFPKSGSEVAFNPPLPATARFGATEVKAAWRVLDPIKDRAVIPRYYTQTGYFLQQDGTTCQGPALFGLISLHILRLTPTTGSTWYWATFEHADNVTPPPGRAGSATLAAPGTPNGACTSAYNVAPSPIPTGNIRWSGTNAPVNVCQTTNISSGVAQLNQRWHGRLAHTVWANYNLVDTLNPSVAGGPAYHIPISTATVNTNILANTALETYVQSNGAGNGQSCMDCHSFAAPQGAPTNPATPSNQIFTFVLSNAATPSSAGSRATASLSPTIPRAQKLPTRVVDIIRRMGSRR